MIVDLFAGPGGWDEGLSQVGRTDVLGIESDKAACETAEAAGHARLSADIAELDPYDIGGSDLEGLIASPPCPGFSSAGKGLGRKDFELLLGAIDDIASGVNPNVVMETVRHRQNDSRSALTLEPLRWAVDLEPEWIALEQVPTVLPLWQAYAEVLRQDGYSVWTGNMQAEQYGVPQTRKRAILIASRTHVVQPPTPTHSRYHTRSPDRLDGGVEKWVSMADALSWGMTRRLSMTVTGGGTTTGGAEPFGNAARQGMLRELDAGRWAYRSTTMANSALRAIDRPAPTIAFGHDAASAQWVPVAAIDGEDPADITWPYTRPSPTIVGSYHPEVVAAPGYRKAGDPPRQKTPGSVRVTVEEAGILQSFRPDYPWQGKQGKQYQQVGNAIPPILAAHVLSAVMARAEDVAA